MQEILNQLLGYVRSTWRYRWVVLIVAWPVALVGWHHVSQIPDQYRASARVYVDTDSMLRPLMRGLAVDTNISQRIALLTRIMLTEPNLQEVARATDMHLRAESLTNMTRITNELRRGISISRARGDDTYTISFSHGDPRLSYEVVRALLNQFMEGALGETRTDTDATQRFLEQQIREHEERLMAAERRLAEFRRDNLGLLPGDRGDYVTRLQRALAQVQETENRLQEVQNRRNEIRRQMVGEEPSFGMFGGPRTRATEALDSRINGLEQRMDELLLNYTERHPDVQAIKRTIASLEAQKDEEIELAIQAGFPLGQLELNPVYQRLRVDLANSEVELSNLRTRLQQQSAAVVDLERQIDTIFEIETQLKNLNRDYNVTRTNFEALLERRERARMSQVMEERGERLQFRVLQSPRVPGSPYAPNRELLLTAVLFGAFGAGAGFAFLIGQLRPVFASRKALKEGTGYPLLGAVSWVMAPRDAFKLRIELISFASVTAGLVIVYLIVVAVGGMQIPFLERWL